MNEESYNHLLKKIEELDKKTIAPKKTVPRQLIPFSMFLKDVNDLAGIMFPAEGLITCITAQLSDGKEAAIQFELSDASGTTTKHMPMKKGLNTWHAPIDVTEGSVLRATFTSDVLNSTVVIGILFKTTKLFF